MQNLELVSDLARCVDESHFSVGWLRWSLFFGIITL